MRAVIVVVLLTACGGGHSNADQCARLHAHRTAIRAQMFRTEGNDDASVAAYNRLVAKANRDFAAMKAARCPLLDFAP